MHKSPLSIPRFRYIFALCWFFIMADHALLLHWFGQHWKVAIIDSLVSNFHLVLAGLVVINALRYYTPRKERYIHLLGWDIFLTAISLLLTTWALKNFLRQETEYIAFLQHSMIIRISLNFLLLGCIILTSMIWYNWNELQGQELRKQDAEKLAREAELFKLRQQLQPHFLFNSLNSINALIGLRPEEARKMVQQLSDFLRGTIKKEEHQWVTLKEELQYLQLYLDIEKVRFGNRLSTDVQTTETSLEMKLPSLLLQPVVENAIKFGLYDTTGDTVISIKTSTEQNNLVVEVQNPFDPETSSPRQGTGFGLKSVQRRLYLLFARHDLLKTEAKENIYITTIKIPQQA